FLCLFLLGGLVITEYAFPSLFSAKFSPLDTKIPAILAGKRERKIGSYCYALKHYRCLFLFQ
ncbi:hypothetical protein, partial [Vibrio vulnificus]|uniref:hypothetical protein n=1 Tax=Vibrio vulnificus TaxID=672 RepID=UPI001A7E11B0